MKISKVLIMAVLLMISFSASAFATEIDFNSDTAFSTPDLSIDLMNETLDIDPPLTEHRMASIVAESRHCVLRSRFDAKTIMPLPKHRYEFRQRYEVGWQI